MIDQSGIVIVEGDISRVQADAIVNAANAELSRGCGVCGAIFRAAGVDKLTEACRTGSAVITPAFDITKARYIIYAARPIYAHHPRDESRKLLRSAYE